MTAQTDRSDNGATTNAAGEVVTPIKAFTPDELKWAFDTVADANDWRAKIYARINIDDRDIVAAAIDWYTGTKADFKDDGNGGLIVTAIGYRAGPCGP
jgi:hypothetical protein